MHVDAFIRVFVCVHTWVRDHLAACTCVYMREYICVCMHACVYISQSPPPKKVLKMASLNLSPTPKIVQLPTPMIYVYCQFYKSSANSAEPTQMPHKSDQMQHFAMPDKVLHRLHM